MTTAAGPVEADILIIGAGPTGLYAAYYAGFRGHRVAVVDSLPELGGQITAMYPEKQILDVAGFPTIKGRDLVAGLVAQAATADPTYLLDRTASTLTSTDDGVVVGLDDGTEVRTGAVLITAGIGKFSPRPLPAQGDWLGRGLEFFVPSFAPYAGKDVVIVGGGDSAFDWAVHLEPVARSVTLVHRRDAFRAHERTVQQVRDSSVQIITKAEVSAITGDGDGGVGRGHRRRRDHDLPCQAVVAALGFIADLGPMQQWGIDVAQAPHRRRPRHADQPPARLRGRRHHRVRRQGATHRRRLRRGRHRRQQRHRRARPERQGVPRSLLRRFLSTPP